MSGGLIFNGQISTGGGTNGNIVLIPDGTGKTIINANVGIGTTNPQQALTLTNGDNFAVNMATPATPTIASSTTGGTLAARTYWFKISASDGVGTTIGTAEKTATTTGSTSSITLSGYSVTGATSYNIYFATSTGAGNENVYISTTTTTFVFATSTVYTAGTVPTVTTAYVNKISASGNSWLGLGGNVGIGTTNPSTALYVVGTTTTNGLLITKGVSYANQAVCYMSDGSLGHQTLAQLTAGTCVGN
jgi:hypothetical protein